MSWHPASVFSTDRFLERGELTTVERMARTVDHESFRRELGKSLLKAAGKTPAQIPQLRAMVKSLEAYSKAYGVAFEHTYGLREALRPS